MTLRDRLRVLREKAKRATASKPENDDTPWPWHENDRHWWFYREADVDGLFWPEWLVRLLRLRCLVVLHRFEESERGPYDDAWYCTRCLGPYEYDEEFVLSSVWSRLLFRIDRRLYRWWHSWSWRFTER